MVHATMDLYKCTERIWKLCRLQHLDRLQLLKTMKIFLKEQGITILRIILEILAFIPVFFILLGLYFETLPLGLDFMSGMLILSIVYILFFIVSWVIRFRSKKSKKIGKSTHFDKAILNLTTTIAAVFTTILIWGLFDMYTQKPPQLFPLNDPAATYTIIKYESGYGIKYKTDKKTEANLTKNCTWIQRKLECQDKYIQDFTATVGLSPTSLDKFVGKEVIVDGFFGNSGNDQMVLFNISSIYEK